MIRRLAFQGISEVIVKVGSELSVLTKLDKTTLAPLLAGMCTFLNVYSTQPLLPLLRRIFHASELQVSFTVSATIFATALTAPLVGMIAERRGRKNVIVPSLFLMTIPAALTATSASLPWFVFWRFLQGLFVPGVIAVMFAYVNEEWAGPGVGRAMSSFVAGTVFGGFLGRFVSGAIAAHWHWRSSFLVLAALNLIGALLVHAWLPPSKNFVRAPHLRQVLKQTVDHLSNLRLLANFGMAAAVLFSLVGCFTYVNFYLAAAPFYLNSAQLGSIFFVYLFAVVVVPQSGRFLDHFGFRLTSVIYCAMMLAGILLTLVKSLPIVIAGLAIFASGAFVAQAAATVQTGVIAARARSSAAGLYLTSYYLGGSLGAMLTGWFWRLAAWNGCVALLGGCALISLWFARISSYPLEQSTLLQVELADE
jgi:YNFM family putative membrane transporter